MALKVGSTYVDELVFNGTNVKEVIVNGTQVDKKYKVTLKAEHRAINNGYSTRNINVLIPHYTASGSITYSTSSIVMRETNQTYTFWVRKGQMMKLDFSPWHYDSSETISHSGVYDTGQPYTIQEGHGTKLILDTKPINSNTVIEIKSSFFQPPAMDFIMASADVQVNSGAGGTYFTKDSGSSADATWA